MCLLTLFPVFHNHRILSALFHPHTPKPHTILLSKTRLIAQLMQLRRCGELEMKKVADHLGVTIRVIFDMNAFLPGRVQQPECELREVAGDGITGSDKGSRLMYEVAYKQLTVIG